VDGQREIGVVHRAARDGWNSIQGGLVAVALVGATLATFGPSFHLPLAYGLLANAVVAATCGFAWADRVAHARTAVPMARRQARSGQVLSGIALVLILYYTGIWIFLVLAAPLVFVVGLLAWSLHRARVAHGVPVLEVRT
jgi:hypothetical protein